MSALPFHVDATVGLRGLAVFTAVVDGEPVTSERYAPGDGQARRRVAAENMQLYEDTFTISGDDIIERINRRKKRDT